ncbi:MAG TPA: hypothetical protein VFQ41_03185, partial [Candidatus Angelobacter sp.]|nr:hypothetical protein [Candidatus Angelobacter sp.]
MVGIETLDDVSALTPGDLTEFEQDKFSLTPDKTPLTTRSEALWKTLDIWITAWEREKLQTKDVSFLLVTNRRCTDPTINKLQADNRLETVNQEVLEVLRSQKKPKHRPKTLQALINSVLARPKRSFTAVVENMLVQSGPGVLDSGLQDKTIEKLHISDVVDARTVYRALYGWLVELILQKWKAGEPAWISRKAFDRQLQITIGTLVHEKVKARAARVIPVSETDKFEARTNRFISHLAAIQMNDSQIDEELIHYIRFSKEKFRLFNDGLIPPREWEFRGDRLQQHWKTVFSQHCTLRDPGEPAERVGMKIFFVLATHREELAGEPMPEAYMT